MAGLSTPAGGGELSLPPLTKDENLSPDVSIACKVAGFVTPKVLATWAENSPVVPRPKALPKSPNIAILHLNLSYLLHRGTLLHETLHVGSLEQVFLRCFF